MPSRLARRSFTGLNCAILRLGAECSCWTHLAVLEQHKIITLNEGSMP
jgi:hypothetical protein